MLKDFLMIFGYFGLGVGGGLLIVIGPTELKIVGGVLILCAAGFLYTIFRDLIRR